ncbi:MAG: ferredoxin [Flavobacteriales bacterium]
MGKDLSKIKHCFLFCNGGSCKKNGAEEFTKEFRKEIKNRDLHESVHTIKTLCMGQCKEGPYMCVLPQNVWYKEMNLEKGKILLDKLINDGEIMKGSILYKTDMDEMNTKYIEDN